MRQTRIGLEDDGACGMAVFRWKWSTSSCRLFLVSHLGMIWGGFCW